MVFQSSFPGALEPALAATPRPKDSQAIAGKRFLLCPPRSTNHPRARARDPGRAGWTCGMFVPRQGQHRAGAQPYLAVAHPSRERAGLAAAAVPGWPGLFVRRPCLSPLLKKGGRECPDADLGRVTPTSLSATSVGRAPGTTRALEHLGSASRHGRLFPASRNAALGRQDQGTFRAARTAGGRDGAAWLPAQIALGSGCGLWRTDTRCLHRLP
jgi:hypothetical protein